MYTFPSRLSFYEHAEVNLDALLPWGVQLVPVQPQAQSVRVGDYRLSATEAGQGFAKPVSERQEYQLSLAGRIPLKRVSVDRVPQLKVMVGGQSVGITIQPEGVMVIGFSPVHQGDGVWRTPGKEAGLKPGDQLLKINDSAVRRVEEAGRAIDQAARRNEPLQLTVSRQNEEAQVLIDPVWDVEASVYRVGIVIRDETSGLGTLTFYSPDNLGYAALGHIVTEMDTQMPIVMERGQLVEVEILGVAKGQQSAPGEKHGQKIGPLIGTIATNNEYGVYGYLRQPLQNPLQPEAVPIALIHEVQPGPATIYTVLDGRTIEAFQIEIEQVFYQSEPGIKGMILHVTDPELLQRSGGIVQGMSGSPIVQNGALVGAVTHVFVNDPARGYGVFAEWMLSESELFDELLHPSAAQGLAA